MTNKSDQENEDDPWVANESWRAQECLVWILIGLVLGFILLIGAGAILIDFRVM